jgi:phosphoserine phosphatase
MTCEAIICDWNGTLFRETDEEAIFRALALNLARSYLPLHLIKIIQLLKVKRKLELLKIQKSIDLSTDRVIEIFRIYNEGVIRGVPMSLIYQLVEKYTRRPEVQGKIVWPMLRPIAELHQAGVTTGILSAGYEYGIRMILKSSGQRGSFDFLEANPLADIDGIASEFRLDIFKNKAEVMLKILKERNLEAKKVVYIGDSLDDIGCFELVGYPVASLLAKEELKQRLYSECKAFVPKDEAELAAYLKSI